MITYSIHGNSNVCFLSFFKRTSLLVSWLASFMCRDDNSRQYWKGWFLFLELKIYRDNFNVSYFVYFYTFLLYTGDFRNFSFVISSNCCLLYNSGVPKLGSHCNVRSVFQPLTLDRKSSRTKTLEAVYSLYPKHNYMHSFAFLYHCHVNVFTHTHNIFLYTQWY